MAHLIDKDILVAEIERLYDEKGAFYAADVLYNLEEWIDALEVKEVDLQKEIDRIWDNTSDNFSEDSWKEFEAIAKHFFELGLKAQKGEEL